MAGTRFSIEVQPRIPERLRRLPELANDLFYSWDRSVRGLFFRLDRELWEKCGHNPKVFLRRVAQQRLDEAAPLMIGMLNNSNRFVVMKAIEALGNIGGSEAFSALLEVTNGDEYELVSAAEEAISRIQEQ